MPILAEVDGRRIALDQRITALGIPDVEVLGTEAIQALDRERHHWRPTCCGCGSEMVLRRYPNRTDWWLFAHKAGEAERCHFGTAGESAAHHNLKILVAEAGRRAGAKPDVEVKCDGGKSDVVLDLDGTRYPFEIQLAELTTNDAIERTEIYASGFGRFPTWLHSGRRSWSRQIPSMQLDDTLETVVGGVYADKRGENLLPPVRLARAVQHTLRINPEAGERFPYIHGEQDGGWGYFYDRHANPATIKQARTPIGPPPAAPRGQLLCPSTVIEPVEVLPVPLLDRDTAIRSCIRIAGDIARDEGRATIRRPDVREAARRLGDPAIAGWIAQ